MTPAEAALSLPDETAASMVSDPRIDKFHLEPRCRVCRNDSMRGKVNDLLSTGASYAMILRALDDDNAALDNRDRVTIDSIRNHCARHFPVQHVAKATYRDILERRARENAVDFIEGVGTAITPIAFYETVMVKGYQTVVDPDTNVDVNTAMIAASRLQALLDTRSGQPDMAAIMVKQNRIIEVMRSMLPESSLPEFVRRLEGLAEPAESLDHQIEASDTDNEGFEPMKFADEDDEDDF